METLAKPRHKFVHDLEVVQVSSAYVQEAWLKLFLLGVWMQFQPMQQTDGHIWEIAIYEVDLPEAADSLAEWLKLNQIPTITDSESRRHYQTGGVVETRGKWED